MRYFEVIICIINTVNNHMRMDFLGEIRITRAAKLADILNDVISERMNSSKGNYRQLTEFNAVTCFSDERYLR